METTYDVRIWRTEIYRGAKTTTYYVRWRVAVAPWKKGFRTRALANNFRAALTAAASRGEAFSVTTGLPVSMTRATRAEDWFTFACSYVDMKWPDQAGKSRMGIAETLTAVTIALLPNRPGRPSANLLRQALYKWAFNARARKAGPAPNSLSPAIAWLQANTPPVSCLQEPDTLRAVVSAVGRKLDGKPAAASTTRRKRAVLHNACAYAVERELLPTNPLTEVRTARTHRTEQQVDRRAVVNPSQAARLLDAVGEQGALGRRLVAFFASMYYAALRPGEAANLTESAIRFGEDDWSELALNGSATTTGAAWSDNGRRRDERGLKHRTPETVRLVPGPPPLTRLLRAHLIDFGTDEMGRLFRSIRENGGDLSDSVYGRVWANARKAALTHEEFNSPLARRPYDLRHAAVSTQLNAGVPPTLVAEWAGHSLAVLLRVYAKCIVGQEEKARERVARALEEQ